MERRARRFQDSVSYRCPHCGEVVDTEPDLGGGFDTTYIEDCPSCCRPNKIRTSYLEDHEAVVIEVSSDV